MVAIVSLTSSKIVVSLRSVLNLRAASRASKTRSSVLNRFGRGRGLESRSAYFARPDSRDSIISAFDRSSGSWSTAVFVCLVAENFPLRAAIRSYSAVFGIFVGKSFAFRSSSSGNARFYGRIGLLLRK